MSHTKAGRMMRTMDVPPAPTIAPDSDRPELNHRTRAESLLLRLDTGGERPPEGMTWPAALTLATVAHAHATLSLASQPPAPISAEAVHEQVVAWCAHLDPDAIERACLEAAEASGAKGASPFVVLPTVLEQAATRWWLGR
jgi:hypothetical protein